MNNTKPKTHKTSYALQLNIGIPSQLFNFVLLCISPCPFSPSVCVFYPMYKPQSNRTALKLKKEMKILGALFTISLLLVQQSISCALRQQILTDFEAKLQKLAVASNPTKTKPPFQFPTSEKVAHAYTNRDFLYIYMKYVDGFNIFYVDLKDGRVFYPIGYGADPAGAEESSDAILKALADALKVQNGSELLPGINDLGGVVIDFQGGNYKISKPIRFPAVASGNLVVSCLSLLLCVYARV